MFCTRFKYFSYGTAELHKEMFSTFDYMNEKDHLLLDNCPVKHVRKHRCQWWQLGPYRHSHFWLMTKLNFFYWVEFILLWLSFPPILQLTLLWLLKVFVSIKHFTLNYRKYLWNYWLFDELRQIWTLQISCCQLVPDELAHVWNRCWVSTSLFSMSKSPYLNMFAQLCNWITDISRSTETIPSVSV